MHVEPTSTNERLRRKLALRIKLDVAQALHAQPLTDDERHDAWVSLTKPEVLDRLIAEMAQEELAHTKSPRLSLVQLAKPRNLIV